jgi:hypothetical protein
MPIAQSTYWSPTTDAAGRAADIRVRVRLAAGTSQVTGELTCIRRRAVGRAGPATGVAFEGWPETGAERGGELGLCSRDRAAPLAEQRCRLGPDPVWIYARGRGGAGHQCRDEAELARCEPITHGHHRPPSGSR